MQITLEAPQDYKLLFSDSSYKFIDTEGDQNFSAPSSTPKLPKLYALYDVLSLHYIGITNQSMSARLRFGLKASGKNGYHGYKWKDKGHLNLSVWTLNQYESEAAYRLLETIEAEIVFLYRLEFGKWPESQHEIHFHNGESIHKALAMEAFEHIKAKIKN